jgi:aspartate racemase
MSAGERVPAMIGLIGGMSWESSVEYYRIINQTMRERLGGQHAARSLMLSVDFGLISRLQEQGRWGQLTGLMCEAAMSLERGGAQVLLICANTMHRMADEVAASVSIPLLHIADPVAAAARGLGARTVGLLGTAYTMEQGFYAGRLRAHGLEVITPEAEDRRLAHAVIYEELTLGRLEPRSRHLYRDIMRRLTDRGAQAMVLGCTELPLLVQAQDSPVPLLDTTRLHALAAVDWALDAAQEGL